MSKIMILFAKILVCMFTLYIAMLFIFNLYKDPLATSRTLPNNQEDKRAKLPVFDAAVETYKFEDPTISYDILSQLDVFKPVDNAIFGSIPTYKGAVYGIRSDDEHTIGYSC